jgi:hypothetical protein
LTALRLGASHIFVVGTGFSVVSRESLACLKRAWELSPRHSPQSLIVVVVAVPGATGAADVFSWLSSFSFYIVERKETAVRVIIVVIAIKGGYACNHVSE